MRYKFKLDKKEELLNDRAIIKLSKYVDINYCYLTRILSSDVVVPFYLAYTISSILGKREDVTYYFDKILK